ncbi:MAG: adenosine deaminase [Candidatus Cloacimonetes bacterium]|nr:adenosine deaminase [Candidatus Cloacimonadota bacterium]
MKKELDLSEFIKQLPKVELHLHIEGTFEPELMFKIAQKNKIKIKYKNVVDLKKAYNFSNLQEFLDVYYAGCKVLLNEEDFYDLTWEYLTKAKSQNIKHTEIMFDPQTHTQRGIKFDTVIKGIHQAMKDVEEELGISSKLIMSILRHLPEESAFETFKQSEPYKKWIDAIGLDSSEVGHPPSKFTNVFAHAKREGYLIVAHAGEEGPPEYVKEALNILKVDRIDHGNRSLENDKITTELVNRKMALTVCPLSNLKLKVVNNLKNHPLRSMLDKGIIATINSDDPAYFGGYLNENFIEIQKALNLTKDEIIRLVKNSINASFLDDIGKNKLLKLLQNHLDNY